MPVVPDLASGQPPPSAPADEGWRSLLRAVSEFARVHAVKSYRLPVPLPAAAPQLPCLDHEAMLHEDAAPHASLYVEEQAGGGLHEIVWVPSRRRIALDVVSTAGEHAPESRARVRRRLAERFPDHEVRIAGPSWLRGDRRVARACRAQVSLRDVLAGDDLDRLAAALDRLDAIGTLMEKQSRVASWSVRTVTGPLLALVGFVSYNALGLLTPRIGAAWVQGLRYVVVGAAGALFLYLGLKAVHLTEMANRRLEAAGGVRPDPGRAPPAGRQPAAAVRRRGAGVYHRCGSSGSRPGARRRSNVLSVTLTKL